MSSEDLIELLTLDDVDTTTCSFGICTECKGAYSLAGCTLNNPYMDKEQWPVIYEGLWCKSCSERISVPAMTLNSKTGTMIVVGPKT